MPTCPACDREFHQLAGHWYYNEDHRPTVSPDVMEMLTGCLLGDGGAQQPNANTVLTVYSTNREFLEHVDDRLGVLSKGVEEKDGGKWTHEDTQYYRVRTVCHPQFNQFADWYGDEGKRFPDDVELTPTVVKYWFACDGGIAVDNPDRGGTYPRAEIHSGNESDNLERLAAWFEDLPVAVPATHRNTFRWGSKGSRQLMRWMGDAVPGFEDKWQPVVAQ